MFRKKDKIFEAGYEKGFEDAVEMIKQIIRSKSEEPQKDGCLQWEDMRNGKAVE